MVNLSGPPLGAFYGLDWCVRPIVCRFLGLPVPERVRVKGILTEDFRGAPPFEFFCFMQVRRRPDGGFAVTPRGRMNSDLASMLRCNAMYISPIGESFLAVGSEIEVELLRNPALLPEEDT